MSLAVRDLWFDYDGSPLLGGINLEVPDGTHGFLLGPSGSGKTSLLRCIAGLERPSRGMVLADGRPLDKLPTHARGVGMLMQEPALFPHLDAAANVAFGLPYRGLPRRERADEARRFLDMVGLAHRADARVDQLSGGQRQRVALARTLAARPRTVLLDEPLSALDRPLRRDLGTRIRDLLADAGVAALWVTHDEEEATLWGDRVWRLVEGQAVAESPDAPTGA